MGVRVGVWVGTGVSVGVEVGVSLGGIGVFVSANCVGVGDTVSGTLICVQAATINKKDTVMVIPPVLLRIRLSLQSAIITSSKIEGNSLIMILYYNCRYRFF
jgi:hypothetical protein